MDGEWTKERLVGSGLAMSNAQDRWETCHLSRVKDGHDRSSASATGFEWMVT
jgi:hypothetical protein